MIASKKHIHTRWCDFPAQVFVDSVKSSFTLNLPLTFCVLVLFSSLLRKLLQLFRCWGIVCPSFYLKILRSEMPLDICVMSFIRLLLYIPLIICIDAGCKCPWLVTASRKVSANSFQGKLIGFTWTTFIPSNIQSESRWLSKFWMGFLTLLELSRRIT